jgi:hypothetical protein
MSEEAIAKASEDFRTALDGMVDAMNNVAFAKGAGLSLIILRDGEHDELLARLLKKSPLRPRIEHAKLAASHRAEGHGFRTLELTVTLDDENGWTAGELIGDPV